MPRQYSHDYAVFIGRFQPFHSGHLSVLRKALEAANRVILLIGSINRPRDIYNVFSFDDRKAMILACLSEGERARVHISGIRDDLYSNARWTEAVQEAVQHVVNLDQWGIDHTPDPVSIAIVGHRRDHTSGYLDFFPQWPLIEVEEIADPAQGSPVTATAIREAFLTPIEEDPACSACVEGLPVPEAVKYFLLGFAAAGDGGEYARLVAEFQFNRNYRRQFEGLKYPVLLQTVDAVVLCAGHILLVKRGQFPGKGLWALPGGYLGEYEEIEDAMVRELIEETRLKVPEVILRSYKFSERFASPNRSQRGRVITEAFLVDIPTPPNRRELPKIKGGSDAAKARWVPLAEFQKMEDQLFEDHFHIVNSMLGKLKTAP